MQSMMEALRKLYVPTAWAHRCSYSQRATSCARVIRLRMSGETALAAPFG
jgi:hypothetical protein